MTTIVHFSDWHGQWSNLPHADMYICTGDMLPNTPIGVITKDREAEFQTRWLEKIQQRGGLRRFLTNRDAPVVVVRGNHEFVDLGPWFGGDVWEISHDSSRVTTKLGLTIGGFRGVSFICGMWSDEYQDSDLEDIVRHMPYDLDIVVSHAGPKGIQCQWGVQALTKRVNEWLYTRDRQPRLFCFGHDHGYLGMTGKDSGSMLFSNAATNKRVITL